MRVFTARLINQTFSKMGDLVCHESEFQEFRAASIGIEFLPEDKDRTV